MGKIEKRSVWETSKSWWAQSLFNQNKRLRLLTAHLPGPYSNEELLVRKCPVRWAIQELLCGFSLKFHCYLLVLTELLTSRSYHFEENFLLRGLIFPEILIEWYLTSNN